MDKNNIYEIAEQSGVSIATVSRVLNNSDKVSSSTRKKVLKVIRDSEYFPRKNKDRKYDILVIINGTENTNQNYVGSYESQLLNGIVKEVKENDDINFHLLFIDHSWPHARVLKSIKERSIDGIIVLQSNEETTYLSVLSDHKVPIVLINNSSIQSFHSIEFENKISTQQAMDYLYDKGHRKIGIFSGHYQFSDIKERVDAASEFLKSKNCYDSNSLVLLPDSENLKYVDNYKRGYEMAKFYIKNGISHTSLLFTNADICLGALSLFAENEIQVPEQLSVITFDENPSFAYYKPALTTISQPLNKMGEVATKTLWDIFKDNANLNSQQKRFSFIGNLTERESCRSI